MFSGEQRLRSASQVWDQPTDVLDEWDESQYIDLNIFVSGSRECKKYAFISYFMSEGCLLDYIENTGNSGRGVAVDGTNYIVQMSTDSGVEDCWGQCDHKEIRRSHAFIFLYRLDQPETLSQLRNTRDRILEHRRQTESIPFLFIAQHPTDNAQALNLNTMLDRISEAEAEARTLGCSFAVYRPGSREIDEIIVNFVHSIASNQIGLGHADMGLNCLEILMVGASMTGKSSFVQKLTTGKIDLHYTPTLDTKIVKHRVVHQGRQYYINFTDTPSVSNSSGPRLESLLSLNGCIVLFSVHSMQSLIEAEDQSRKIVERGAGKLPTLLLATHTDSPFSRQVSTQEGESLARRYGWLYAEVSLLNCAVDVLLHPLLHSISGQHEAIAHLQQTEMTGRLVWSTAGKFQQWKPFTYHFKDGNMWPDDPKDPKSYKGKRSVTVEDMASIDSGGLRNSDGKSKEAMYSFSITTTAGKQHLFGANTEAERDQWLVVLRGAKLMDDYTTQMMDEVVEDMLAELVLPYCTGADTLTRKLQGSHNVRRTFLVKRASAYSAHTSSPEPSPKASRKSIIPGGLSDKTGTLKKRDSKRNLRDSFNLGTLNKRPEGLRLSSNESIFGEK
ncbi:GTP-binding protein Rit2-like [Planoprotostelium fungivorum]|uniref:GTP-binding protein Rit2-like n=1 Tax=Planoprotostelium fungivorum TaxID=1890364 RepID=A0A2P6MSV3_9EUKA|nr:GTP-binding protein Rit2-like [Planoprotostelium fungivorum]